MADENKFHKISRVVARYPKIDKPYRFDNTAGEKGRSVPCSATDDGAKYELEFVLTATQAKDLYKVMNTEYKNSPKRDGSWKDKLPQPFKEQEDGTFIGKTTIKAAYDGTPTRLPEQFDAKNTRLPEGFQLTTGSTVNIAVILVPYKMSETGVSLRLRAVQVLDLAPMMSASPFEATDGFVNEDGFPTAETTTITSVGEAKEADELFDEPKVKAPKVEIIPATPEAKEVNSLLDKWDDE